MPLLQRSAAAAAKRHRCCSAPLPMQPNATGALSPRRLAMILTHCGARAPLRCARSWRRLEFYAAMARHAPPLPLSLLPCSTYH